MNRFDRIEGKLDDIQKGVTNCCTTLAVHDQRLSVIESHVASRNESRRHWGRYVVTALVGLFLVLIGAVAKSQLGG